jgi:hypothetical protein
VSTHRSDPTSFTVTIIDDWIPNASGAGANRLYSDQRSYTFRANTAEKAGKWVSRLSSLHGMLHQPLLPPGPRNPRLYRPVIADFVQTYTEGHSTYLCAAEKAFAKQSGALTATTSTSPVAEDSSSSPTASAYASGSHFHHSVTTTLASCGGGGSADADTDSSLHSAPIPHTARCASHWAGGDFITLHCYRNRRTWCGPCPHRGPSGTRQREPRRPAVEASHALQRHHVDAAHGAGGGGQPAHAFAVSGAHSSDSLAAT